MKDSAYHYVFKSKRSQLTVTVMNSNEDYYIENGLYVFTEAYHLKRGYCCNSGCRHCPYPKEDHKKSSDENNSSDDNISNDDKSI